MSWTHPAPFVIRHRVSADDLDILNHANNCEYLRWLERAAWAHTESLGLGWEQYQALGHAVVARRHEIEYLAPALEGDDLQIGTWVEENSGRLDMWRGYQIVRESDHKTLLTGRTRWVCIALDSGRPARMPKAFVEGYKVLTQ